MGTLSRRQFLGWTGAVSGLVVAGFNPGSCRPEATRRLSGNVVLAGAFTVPDDKTWEFDPYQSTTVTVVGNVVIEGILRMRPAHAGVVHTLRFAGIDERRVVGSHTSHPLDTDVGLWVIGAGRLDLQGTPRAGWNRTGNDPTWATSDELVVAPNDPSIPTKPKPFTSFRLGDPVPTVEGYATEVANLTRNVRIEGAPGHRAHIQFLHCTQPQTLKHVSIRYMGPTHSTGQVDRGVAHQSPVLGRYGLHFHMCDEGSRGSLIEGVVVRDCGGPAFVTHLSNGVTYRDCVAYQASDFAYWWDPDTASHDVTYDHCAAFNTLTNPDYRHSSGFVLGEGTNLSARDCVAVGTRAKTTNSGGFHWPSKANQNDNVWKITDCIAHNNRGPGFGIWQNDSNPHVLEDFTSYRNDVGISHGAYSNAYTYRNGRCFGNGADLHQFATGAITFDRVGLPEVVIREHQKQVDLPTRYLDCLIGRVVVDERGASGVFEFRSTNPRFDLTRDQFEVVKRVSTISVHNSDGSTFVVT